LRAPKTVDSQLQELNTQFKEDTMLILSTSLDHRDGFRSFNIENTCKLAKKDYPMDSTEQEKYHLRYKLQNYKLDVSRHPEFQNLSTISKLSDCWRRQESARYIIFSIG
jgi:UDP-N-acetylglucosamine pyrophosphorylase